MRIFMLKSKAGICNVVTQNETVKPALLSDKILVWNIFKFGQFVWNYAGSDKYALVTKAVFSPVQQYLLPKNEHTLQQQ
jgi:hypothetical protein